MNINKCFKSISIVVLISIFLANVTYSMGEGSAISSQDQDADQNSLSKKLKKEASKQEVKKLSVNCSVTSLVHICLYNAIKTQPKALARILNDGRFESLKHLAAGLCRMIKSEDSKGCLLPSKQLILELLDTKMLDFALDSMPTIDFECECNWTALTWAVWKGYIEQVKAILQRKDLIVEISVEEYVNRLSHFNHRALDFAALAGKGNGLVLKVRPDEEVYVEIVKILLEHGAKKKYPAFKNAIFYGNYKIAKVLLEYGVKPKSIDFITIQKNQHEGYLEMLSLILKNGIDINCSDGKKTPLVWAAFAGDMDQVNLLLPFKDIIKPYRQINGAFIYAQAGKYDKKTELLSDIEDSQNGVTMRLWEVLDEEEYARERLDRCIGKTKKDYYGVMSALLDLGADVNIKDTGKHQLNALLRATGANDIEMVKLLLKCGADKKVTDLKGRTPLDIAKENGFEEMVFLLEKGFAISEFLA